jgi:hypothetical protein
MRVARPDAQAASRYRPWLERRPISRSLEPATRARIDRTGVQRAAVWVGEAAWPRSCRTDIRRGHASTGTRRGSEAVIEATGTAPMRVVNISPLAVILIIFLVALTPACAADNLSIQRLATCQDSWLDWKKSDSVQLKKFAESFQSDFSRKEKDPFFVPKSNQTVAGLPVVQVFPESIGMAVGFSVVVNADLDTTKTSLAKKIGKSFSKCEPPSDNMRTCEMEIGEKKTILLMAEDNVKSKTTLFGCYYFYAK